MSRRLYGADDLSMDMSLCEDAHFALKVVDPLTLPSNAVLASAGLHEPIVHGGVVNTILDPVVGWGSTADSGRLVEVNSVHAVNPHYDTSKSHIYLCVADGVGSWRQFGVDPRLYSHR